jgi:hypothetical protein
MPTEVLVFAVDVAAQLKTYVYRLIDPRNGETFHVGKGTGNRVFSHIREQVAEDEADGGSSKLRRIRDTHRTGFEVAHVIHRRHGRGHRVRARGRPDRRVPGARQ